MQDYLSFKKLLDNQYDWPTRYTFKFIVPCDKVKNIKDLLGDGFEVLERPSRSGKYISCIVHRNISSSDEVVEVYKAISTVEGVISL